MNIFKSIKKLLAQGLRKNYFRDATKNELSRFCLGFSTFLSNNNATAAFAGCSVRRLVVINVGIIHFLLQIYDYGQSSLFGCLSL